MSFASMKKSSSDELNKLTSAMEKLNSPKQFKNGPDERFWKPEVDKAGNGYAVIRFLPASEGEDVPFVRVWDHGFQGPTGQWYIEKSLTTLGNKDPVSEYNNMLWNSGIESNKDLVRKYKRRLSFYSNILVVSDSNNPQNEGKVFLFKYGKKIFEKLNDLMNPSFEDETPVNPFDLWTGANFKLKIRNVEGFRNYDKSEFDTPKAINDDDAKLEAIWNSQYKLSEFTDPENFKSYDELKTKLYRVLALDSEVTETPTFNQTTAEAPSIPSAAEVSAPTTEVDDSQDDETLSFFKKLAADQ